MSTVRTHFLRVLGGLAVVTAVASCAPAAPDAPPAEVAAEPGAGAGQEVAALRSLLDDFLAHAGERFAHERFWADDLVYTSSRGTRTTKAEILAGMAPAGGDAPAGAGGGEAVDGGQPEAGPTYWAEDVEIRLYGTTAVVAFRLMIQPPEGSGQEPSFNFNTGTFVKRDGEWRAVAWQSTVGAP